MFYLILISVSKALNWLLYNFSNLRLDSLAQMLTQGNIRADMTVAVVDSCMGLVTGAVLERLGGKFKTSFK